MYHCYVCHISFKDDHIAKIHRTLTTHSVVDKDEAESNTINKQAGNLIINTKHVVKRLYDKTSEISQRS